MTIQRFHRLLSHEARPDTLFRALESFRRLAPGKAHVLLASQDEPSSDWWPWRPTERVRVTAS